MMEGKVLTPKEIQEIVERAEKATEGPWLGFYDNDGGADEILVASKVGCGAEAFRHATCPICAVDGANQDAGLVLGWGSQVNKDNAEFIAHARQDIPNLLATLSDHDSRVKALVGLLTKAMLLVDWLEEEYRDDPAGGYHPWAPSGLDSDDRLASVQAQSHEFRTALEPFKEGG